MNDLNAFADDLMQHGLFDHAADVVEFFTRPDRYEQERLHYERRPHDASLCLYCLADIEVVPLPIVTAEGVARELRDKYGWSPGPTAPRLAHDEEGVLQPYGGPFEHGGESGGA